jgi:hypothetical protein
MKVAEQLAEASPEVRAAALELLDKVSRPLKARELTRALAAEGFRLPEARRITLALKRFSIIALLPIR